MFLTVAFFLVFQDSATTVGQADPLSGIVNEETAQRSCNAPCEQYDSLIAELKQALEANDRATVSTLFHYPFCVNRDGCERYETPEEVLRDFDRIFSPRLRELIARQGVTDHWINYQGAMIGSGEIWYEALCLDEHCDVSTPVRIRTINVIDLPLED